MIFIVLSVSIVGAADIDSGDVVPCDNSSTLMMESDQGEHQSMETPSIDVNSSQITTGDEIEISLMDSNKISLSNKNLTVTINKEERSLFTDENGIAKLKLDLPANKYILNVKFIGDDNYAPVDKNFNIDILKSNLTLSFGKTSLKYGEKFDVYLKDSNGNPIKAIPIEFKVNGKKYTYNTNSEGCTGLKIKLPDGKYNIDLNFAGNDYYEAVGDNVKITVLTTTSIEIGNSILLTNGYLRIYLKSNSQSAIAKKVVKITINNKVFTKKTNSEGIIVFKPKVGTGKLTVTAEFAGNSAIAACKVVKQVKGIKGNAKNPLKSKIPLNKGIPNVDYMTWNYVMGDGNMKYTLLKSQYKDVLKRDSYCLFLNKKLSKYTFFATKSEPKLNHIIKREKWNVIEREINTIIVKKNKHGYWPGQVTVSLKGKSYTYAEVRDVQNEGYTCGPTAASMCTQVLKNYFCEKYLAKKAGSDPYYGSSTKGLKKALEKSHFKCSYYYKSSFNKALKQLKKGGCALVFHTWYHYVSIIDISKDGKKVLMGNPSGDYDHGSHKIPTKWVTVKYIKKCFNNYDTSGLVVKLKYNLKKSTKNQINTFYSNMGTKWTRQNVNERIPQIQAPFY